MPPNFEYEQQHAGLVAGIDEAGRGPWAGPVVAAAVILDVKNIPQGIDDSKKLSAAKREALFDFIMQHAQVGVGLASVDEIDQLNILGATKLAMQRALTALPVRADVALVDGNQPPKLPCTAISIIKGDSKSLSIAAASIIAKVTRDRMMCELAREFPHYGWEKNAGYGTALHQKGLAEFGVTPHHRRSFAPIRELLARAA
ncbi:MAG: ribonuclease HII [Alphaproteobacteria bacterium]|nr:ribonuclease HII [Alphaproteobacteria bacterium]